MTGKVDISQIDQNQLTHEGGRNTVGERNPAPVDR